MLTLTPHIIRIPDITEEDLMPVYVGTDANISYQGTPRVENPNRDAGPFEPPAGGRPQPRMPQPTPPAPPSVVVPGTGPSDIFKPQPANPPTSPREQVPPQGANAPSSDVSVAALSAATGPSDGTTHVLLDFDPAYTALSVGQQQSILVRATSAAGFPGGTLTIRFDPSVAAVVGVRPILGSGTGMAESRIDSDRVVIQIPESPDLSGTRAVAEITLRGIAPGRAALAFEPMEMPGASVTLSQAVVEIR